MRSFVGMALVLTAVLATSAAAIGASGKPGGVYVGDIKSSPFTMHVNMAMNRSGAALQHFTYLCGTGRPPTTVFNLIVDHTGHFKYTSNPSTGHAWKMAGHFLSHSSAFVSINSIDCGGSKGSTTVKLK